MLLNFKYYLRVTSAVISMYNDAGCSTFLAPVICRCDDERKDVLRMTKKIELKSTA